MAKVRSKLRLRNEIRDIIKSRITTDNIIQEPKLIVFSKGFKPELKEVYALNETTQTITIDETREIPFLISKEEGRVINVYYEYPKRFIYP